MVFCDFGLYAFLCIGKSGIVHLNIFSDTSKLKLSDKELNFLLSHLNKTQIIELNSKSQTINYKHCANWRIFYNIMLRTHCDNR